MRSIQVILRNLLIATAALVLFSSVGWAGKDINAKLAKITCDGMQAGINCGLVETCKGQASSIVTLKEKEMAAAVSVGTAGGAIADKNQGAGGVQITDNSCGYSAFTSENSAILVKEASASYAICMSTCSGEKINPKPIEGELSADKTKDKLEELREDLCGGIKIFAISHQQGISSSMATCMAAKKARGSLLTKVAIGGAVVGGGLLLMDHIGDKKEKKKEKKEEEAKKKLAEGIIKDADGNDLACFSEQNYMRLECNQTMLGLCQAGKADTAGCKAFNSNYCASTGSGSNYCLYADSKNYCSQTGSMVASSPACQWANARSSECKSNPEQVSCLYSGSADALTLACANYPSDPLCAAHVGGRIVVQGGSTATTTAATESTGTADGAGTSADYGDGSSVSMSSVISSDGSTSSTTAADSTALASTDSMWASSSSVAAKACANGLLQNCSN